MQLECSSPPIEVSCKKFLTKQTICRPFLSSGLTPGIDFKWIPQKNLQHKKKLKIKRGEQWRKEGGEYEQLPPTVTADVIQWHRCHLVPSDLTCLTGIPYGYGCPTISSSKTTSMIPFLYGTSIHPPPVFPTLTC